MIYSFSLSFSIVLYLLLDAECIKDQTGPQKSNISSKVTINLQCPLSQKTPHPNLFTRQLQIKIQTHIHKDNLQMRHEYLAIQSLAQSHKFNSVNFTYQTSKEYKSVRI